MKPKLITVTFRNLYIGHFSLENKNCVSRPSSAVQMAATTRSTFLETLLRINTLHNSIQAKQYSKYSFAGETIVTQYQQEYSEPMIIRTQTLQHATVHNDQLAALLAPLPPPPYDQGDQRHGGASPKPIAAIMDGSSSLAQPSPRRHRKSSAKKSKKCSQCGLQPGAACSRNDSLALATRDKDEIIEELIDLTKLAMTTMERIKTELWH